MRAPFITGWLTAAVVAAALPLSHAASAADLYGDGYGEPPSYDDSAYAHDGYPRYGEAQPEPDDAYDDEPLPGSVKDGYPVPMPPPAASAPPPRYAERPPVRVERYAGCLDRWQIRRELRREGWDDIRPLGGDDGIVHIRARRHESGRPFELRVDRCSGEVLAAEPRHHHRHRGVAYRDWRWVK